MRVTVTRMRCATAAYAVGASSLADGLGGKEPTYRQMPLPLVDKCPYCSAKKGEKGKRRLTGRVKGGAG